MSAIHFSHVFFAYSSAVPIADDVSFDLGEGWAGLVGANGAGKSTLLSLVAGDLTPDSGSVIVEPSGLPAVLCEQRVDALTESISGFAVDWSRDAVRMRSALGLEASDIDRWATLSPGERKRWQIGSALSADPTVLLLDEPTNHLDREARTLLIAALRTFRGCGVIVSHDRTLLNDLTSRTVWMSGGTIDVWNGPYDVAKDARDRAATETLERYEKMRSEQKKLERRLDDRRRTSAQKDAERMRERRSAGKHDLDTRGSAASYKHERGQKTGAQTVASMSTSLERVTEAIAATVVNKERGGSIAFDFAPASKEFLIRHTGTVTAGDSVLFDVDLGVRRGDRIRIAGPNGAGKTSLVAALMTSLAIPDERVLRLAQETTADEARQWLDDVRALDDADTGRVMSLVARLGADPAALLASDQPSPGEARKVALALGLGTPKWLLILDEPTNHLDLPSIERLEEALASYDGALILITHDDRLAAGVTDATWFVEPTGVTVGGRTPVVERP